MSPVLSNSVRLISRLIETKVFLAVGLTEAKYLDTCFMLESRLYNVDDFLFFCNQNHYSLMRKITVLPCSRMVFDNQTTYVFIPGKNWKLSLAELVSFLQTREYRFDVCEFTESFFVVNIDKSLNALVIADLGGILKIARLASNIATQAVKEAFLHENKEAQTQVKRGLSSSGVANEMLGTSSGRLVFGVSVYYADRSFRQISKSMQRFLGSFLKHELSAHGKRSGFMGFPRGRKQPQLSHVEVLKKGLVERKAEVLFCIGKTRAAVSTTMAVHNPFEFQKRDIGRPVQRKIFAMPPRLARIMVNLASCTPGKSLLDPFCGVGTILQEALLAKARVVGVDMNPWCVEATRENLAWLEKEYKLKETEYTVTQGDSRRLTNIIQKEVDCITTEPDLGPALRQIPTTPYATRIIDKLKPLYCDFLGEAYKSLKKDGRLVLVTPYIKTRSGKAVTMRIEEKALAAGFNSVYPFQSHVLAVDDTTKDDMTRMSSFVDVGEKHKIGREIHIFQK